MARLPAPKSKKPRSSSRPPVASSGPVVHKESAEARQFAIEAARTLADNRCHQVVVLNVSGLSPVTDYFVIGTGTSGRQMRTAVDAVEELSPTHGYGKLSRSGDDSANWIVLDCFDVVVHAFTQEARSYYDMDGMWGDAKRVEWERPEKS